MARLAKLEAEVTELKKNEALAKKSAIEEYKSSDDFQEVVEFTASKYFGGASTFAKGKLAISISTLTSKTWGSMPRCSRKKRRGEEENEEEEKEKENEKEEEKEKKNDGEKDDTSPLSP